jgi:hypothetical protein
VRKIIIIIIIIIIISSSSISSSNSSSANSSSKGKAIRVQAWTGPEFSRRLRLQDLQTFGR